MGIIFSGLKPDQIFPRWLGNKIRSGKQLTMSDPFESALYKPDMVKQCEKILTLWI